MFNKYGFLKESEDEDVFMRGFKELWDEKENGLRI